METFEELIATVYPFFLQIVENLRYMAGSHTYSTATAHIALQLLLPTPKG